MRSVHAFDMHCDTLMRAYLNGEADFFAMDSMLNGEKLRRGGAMAQFFAIFVPPASYYGEKGMKPIPNGVYIEGCRKTLENTLAAHPDALAPAFCAGDVERNFAAGLVSAVLTMEDGVEVRGSMDRLDGFYAMGVRALSLTWNFANCFGWPNSRDPAGMAKGLTPFGAEAVRHMQDIGMLVDVSHLSDGGFWDVARAARKPFAATHSNCRAVCPHPRNMTDEMIRALADAGGVMGINFCAGFLNGAPSVANMVEMAKHEKKVGGIGVIALGTDFDGISATPEVTGPDGMGLLADGLSAGGFTDGEIDLIMNGNAMRVFRDAVK